MKKIRLNAIASKKIYSVTDAAKSCGVHTNTVLRWINDGLKIIGSKRPYLILGDDLVRYLRERRRKRKRKMQVDQAFCCRCRQPSHFYKGHITVLPHSRYTHQVFLKGQCEACKGTIRKIWPSARLSALQRKTGIVLFNMNQHSIPLVKSVFEKVDNLKKKGGVLCSFVRSLLR